MNFFSKKFILGKKKHTKNACFNKLLTKKHTKKAALTMEKNVPHP